MRLGDDDDVVETLSSDRVDQAFDVRILPCTRSRGDDVGDTDARESALEDVTVRCGLDLSATSAAPRPGNASTTWWAAHVAVG
jgi:hypothetical protein